MARRRVRLAIRAARSRKGMTQSDVAAAMDWSLSKVMRIEKGEVNVSSSDLRLLLALLDVTGTDEVQRLMADARLARQERWTVDSQDREHLTPAMIELIQYEAAATSIRYFQNLVVPGILQTRAYAEAIFAHYRGEMDPDTVAARIESRQRRRQDVLHRPSPPEYLVVLDESVLWRPVGGPAIMGEQLDELARLVEGTTLHVKILDFRGSMRHLAFHGPFALYSLDDDQSALLYREHPLGDDTVRTPAVIDLHRIWFEQLWSVALDDSSSLHMIKERALAFRSE